MKNDSAVNNLECFSFKVIYNIFKIKQTPCYNGKNTNYEYTTMLVNTN